MSGSSDSVECPNCGMDCNRYEDSKPYDMCELTCLHCGLYTETILKYHTLEELNDVRGDELEPLTELPTQKPL